MTTREDMIVDPDDDMVQQMGPAVASAPATTPTARHIDENLYDGSTGEYFAHCLA